MKAAGPPRGNANAAQARPVGTSLNPREELASFVVCFSGKSGVHSSCNCKMCKQLVRFRQDFINLATNVHFSM